MKIFFYFLRPYDELEIAQRLCREAGIEFDYTTEYPNENNYALAKGSDAISITPCNLGTEVVEKFHALGVKYITNRSIGYDHVDVARANELGMRVANASYPPDGVANYAIMLMMMAARGVSEILQRGAVQDFTLKGKIGRDLSGMTVGIIGTGRIGQTVIRHLSGFGCRMLCYDLYRDPETEKLARYVPLDELLRESDVVTLHCNVTDETYHLLDEEAIAKMKDGVIIVNTARGKLIDSKALIAALKSGKAGAAALDVLEDENGLYYYDRVGDIIDNPEMAELRSFPNVLLTCHTAFYTHEAVENMAKSCVDSVLAFERGEKTPHEVGHIAL